MAGFPLFTFPGSSLKSVLLPFRSFLDGTGRYRSCLCGAMRCKAECNQPWRWSPRRVARSARQPFPGPGLAIRIIGDVTPEKVAIVQDADAIWREEVDKLPMAQRPSQYFAALTNMRSVGVMGDERTYDYAIALRAVTTTDFMTAEVTILPTETITTAANRIVNEVKNINRGMFDYTTKPPATIEFE